MHMQFRSDPQIMTLLKYFKHIEPSKEERIQGILPKTDRCFGKSNAKLSNRNCL